MKTRTAAQPSGWEDLDSGFAQVRVANRVSIAFLLDVIAVARGDRHLVDSLLMSAIVQANVAQISGRADLQVAYATMEDAPPDEARRPVSINALANSLGLPFETTRRRLHALIKAGLVTPVDGGLIITSAVLTSPEYLQSAFAGYARIVRFYQELKAEGLLADLPPPTVALEPGAAPLRIVARLATDYALRVTAALMGHFGDIRDSLIFISIVRCNTEALSPRERGGPGVFETDFVDDQLRRPVSTLALARATGLPAETVRRHAAKLAEKGLCQVVAGRGYVVPAEVLARPECVQTMEENWRDLQRLFAALAKFGILEIWDASTGG